MRLLMTFIRSQPRQSAVLLTALLLAGAAEGASLSALLPPLSFAISQARLMRLTESMSWKTAR